RARALQGGERGVDILPGDSAKSPLIHYVSRLVEDMEMPPDGKGRALTPEKIGLLRAWIDQGAAWPASLNDKESGAREEHWAFKPVSRPAPPQVHQGEWPRNP